MGYGAAWVLVVSLIGIKIFAQRTIWLEAKGQSTVVFMLLTPPGPCGDESAILELNYGKN